jgi:urea transport system permease protein
MLTTFKKLPINRMIDMLVLIFLVTFPFYQKTYWIYIMSGIMAYIIFALSLDLLWGYTGLMSMGHSVLFGAGGYMVGISCAYLNQASWVKFDKLPWFLSLLGSDSGGFAMGLIVPGVIALFIGLFMFSGKIQGVFFSLITLAIAGIAELFVVNQSTYTHGDSGITVTGRTVISNSADDKMTDFQYYFVVLAFLVLAYIVCMLLSHSRTGKVLQSVRENEARLTFLGYRPAAFKLFVFVISGVMAGLAGMLYVRVQGSINYTSVGISLATLVLVWVAVGGRGNLTGAILGTLLLEVAQTKMNSVFSGISADFAQYWKLALGVLILVIVFLIPDGVIGTLIGHQQKRRDRARKERIAAKEEATAHE